MHALTARICAHFEHNHIAVLAFSSWVLLFCSFIPQCILLLPYLCRFSTIFPLRNRLVCLHSRKMSILFSVTFSAKSVTFSIRLFSPLFPAHLFSLLNRHMPTYLYTCENEMKRCDGNVDWEKQWIFCIENISEVIVFLWGRFFRCLKLQRKKQQRPQFEIVLNGILIDHFCLFDSLCRAWKVIGALTNLQKKKRKIQIEMRVRI